MSRYRFSEQQIHNALSRVQRGECVLAVSDELGVSPQTVYRWRRRYGGTPARLIERIKALEEDLRRLRTLVSDLTLERNLLKDVLKAEDRPPRQRRAEVRTLQVAHGVSERKVCQALGWSRSSIRYESVADDQRRLRRRLRELAVSRPRSGYRTLWQLLRREGWQVNHKRIYRLYRAEGLGDSDTRDRLAEEMKQSGSHPAPYQPAQSTGSVARVTQYA